MSRVPGTYRRPAHVLYVLPSIPDDAPDGLKDGLAIRNVCMTEGRCPACGVTPTYSVDDTGIGHLTFAHEDECRVLRDDGTTGT